MSQWKQLAGELKKSKIFSASNPQKYTPKKKPRNEKSPYNFHNKTIDGLQSSFLTQEKQKSFLRNLSRDQSVQQPRISRNLKASSSEIKLKIHDAADYQNKNSITSHQASFLNPDQARIKDKMKRSFIGRAQKTYLFQQIQKVKKQFSIFQNIVLKQLQKQQKFINETLEQIMKQMQSQTSQVKRWQPTFLQELNLPKADEYIQKYAQSQISHSDAFLNKFTNTKQLTKQDTIKLDSQNQALRMTQSKQKQQNKSFERIFTAVQNLKKDIIQMTVIGDMSIATSPKSQMRSINWGNLLIQQK